MRRSTIDPSRRAVVVDRRPLRFDTDAPWPHVRAASALVRIGRSALVVQDDALYLAEVGGSVRPVPLPSADGRVLFDASDGTKKHKPDLEAATFLPDGRLVLIGSGSTDARERWFVRAPSGEIAVHALPDLYDVLRTAVGDAELNVEGALVDGDRVALFQRGNGRGGVNAELSVPLAWIVGRLLGPVAAGPAVGSVGWDLGDLDGGRLTFTDVYRTGPGAFAYLASAEDSPNAVDDGRVVGSALGWATPTEARWAPIVSEDGALLAIKAEGLAPADAPDTWLVTTDADDVRAPSELLTVELRRA